MDEKRFKDVIAQVSFEQRDTRRQRAREYRPKQNAAYVAALPEKTLNSIIAQLNADANMKRIARMHSVPHNIVVYIWEHHL